MHRIAARQGLALSRSTTRSSSQSIRRFGASSRAAAEDQPPTASTERRPSATSTLAQSGPDTTTSSQQQRYIPRGTKTGQDKPGNASASALEGLSRMMTEGETGTGKSWGPLSALLENARDFDASSSSMFTNPGGGGKTDPFSVHIFSSRHNTHITFTRPNGEPIVSKSGGNLGFKHSNRGSFDAAYQLTLNLFDTMKSPKYENEMQGLRVVLRGFGNGREAFVKALLGQEGGWLKNRVVAVLDSTRLKFGGTRSKKPRRL